jgi:hypothetical protein
MVLPVQPRRSLPASAVTIKPAPVKLAGLLADLAPNVSETWFLLLTSLVKRINWRSTPLHSFVCLFLGGGCHSPSLLASCRTCWVN